jgi:FMN-dependent NADH-azoreductase
MKNILVLKSGLNGDNSNSNKLVDTFLQTHRNDNDSLVVRDLAKEALPHLSAEEMAAWMTPEGERSAEQQMLAQISDKAIDELLAADLVVIGMPLYNMGVPSTFKAYIDRIARAGKTFAYTEQGPQGLVKNTKVVVLAARGGKYAGTPMDSQTGFIQGIFGLMGVDSVEFVYAEGLNMGEDAANQAWQQAEQKIAQMD